MINPAVTIAIIAFLIVTALLLWWLFKAPSYAYVTYTKELPDWNFSFRIYDTLADFDRNELSLGPQSQKWKDLMQSIGKVQEERRVRQVYFVHGTFVGHDPWGAIEALKIFYPGIDKRAATTIAKLIKSNSDRIFRDNGNYTKEYIELYEAAMNAAPCEAIHWSSGNHHLARLRGAIHLISTVAERIRKRDLGDDDHILIHGHSHAGQLFALVAILSSYNEHAYALVRIAEEAGYKANDLWRDISHLNRVTLDYVAYGTPPVYQWPDEGYWRLMNLINHRGSTHLAGSLSGILQTKGGDYVQQLGIRGTDLLAATPQERKINRALDEILGEGQNLASWSESIKHKMRVPPFGRTFLINYKDDSEWPNFLQTFFGHGVYTRYETMLFHSALIAEFYYRWEHPSVNL